MIEIMTLSSMMIEMANIIIPNPLSSRDKFMIIIVIIIRLASKLAPSLHPLELSLYTAAWVTGVLLSMARWE